MPSVLFSIYAFQMIENTTWLNIVYYIPITKERERRFILRRMCKCNESITKLDDPVRSYVSGADSQELIVRWLVDPDPPKENVYSQEIPVLFSAIKRTYLGRNEGFLLCLLIPSNGFAPKSHQIPKWKRIPVMGDCV